jgi:RNA polymerase sigma factor (sigma-70 family)
MPRSSRTDHQWLRKLLSAVPTSRLPDAELLDQFRSGSSRLAADAFDSLLLRHGPMVLAVCRRLVGDPHDAEDAFQATFLIFATRARSIRAQESVASWLHGVALRIASRLRASTERRRAEERRIAEMADQGVDPEVTRADDATLDHEALHQEVQRLPRKYREVVVLCYLQGMTQEAAARQLHCPSSTVGVRLMRARTQLKARLSRRGIWRPGEEDLAPLLLCYALPEPPDSLADSTTSLVMGTDGRPLSRAAQLAEEILESRVLFNRPRWASLAFLPCLSLPALGGSLAASTTGPVIGTVGMLSSIAAGITAVIVKSAAMVKRPGEAVRAFLRWFNPPALPASSTVPEVVPDVTGTGWFNPRALPASSTASTTSLVFRNWRKLSPSAAHVTAGIFKSGVMAKSTGIASVVLAATLATASVGAVLISAESLSAVNSWSHQTDPAPVVTQYSAMLRDEDRSVPSDRTYRIDSHDRDELTPIIVPEPSTFVIAITMAMFLGGYAYFRRGKAKRPGISRRPASTGAALEPATILEETCHKAAAGNDV